MQRHDSGMWPSHSEARELQKSAMFRLLAPLVPQMIQRALCVVTQLFPLIEESSDEPPEGFLSLCFEFFKHASSTWCLLHKVYTARQTLTPNSSHQSQHNKRSPRKADRLHLSLSTAFYISLGHLEIYTDSLREFMSCPPTLIYEAHCGHELVYTERHLIHRLCTQMLKKEKGRERTK